MGNSARFRKGPIIDGPRDNIKKKSQQTTQRRREGRE